MEPALCSCSLAQLFACGFHEVFKLRDLLKKRKIDFFIALEGKRGVANGKLFSV